MNDYPVDPLAIRDYSPRCFSTTFTTFSANVRFFESLNQQLRGKVFYSIVPVLNSIQYWALSLSFGALDSLRLQGRPKNEPLAGWHIDEHWERCLPAERLFILEVLEKLPSQSNCLWISKSRILIRKSRLSCYDCGKTSTRLPQDSVLSSSNGS